jgi:hypothetical protein
MLDPNILIGEPLDFKNKIKIYPPTVREVVSNPNFGIFYKVLTITQEEIDYELSKKMQPGETKPSPFEYLILNAQYVNGFANILKQAFVFFCHTEITLLFDEKKIMIGKVSDVVQTIKKVEDISYLLEEDFFDF